jgi:hypothetical protein
MLKTIYLNLEDDVPRITGKLKREAASDVVLVFPKKSFLFSDPINLRLLKKQTDILGKQVSVLTMDEKGQEYATNAGFELKTMPKPRAAVGTSDIRRAPKKKVEEVEAEAAVAAAAAAAEAAVPKTRRATPKVAAAPVMAATVVAADTEPAEEPSEPGSIETISSSDSFFSSPTDDNFTIPHHARRRWVGITTALVIAAVLLGTVFVAVPSARITLYGKTQAVVRDIEVTGDITAQTANPASLTVPAMAVTKTDTVKQTFQTLGKKELGSKAQGRVVLYNLTGSPINLRATTTTLSIGGKNYTFNQDQSGVKPLPSAQDDKNASVADITAVEGGESYNLPSGTRLEITNQAFGSQPQRLYAKTLTQVVGGSSRFISVIGKEDVKQAEDGLVAPLLKAANEDTMAQGFTILEGASVSKFDGFAIDKPEGTETPTYNAQANVTVTAVAINLDMLQTMLRTRLQASLGTGRTLQAADRDKVTYTVKSFDATRGVIALSIRYESEAVPVVDAPILQRSLAGTSRTRAGDIILSDERIDRVEFDIFPGWQNWMPFLASRIKLIVR